MTKLRVLDLFSGIGGFSLGLERTGGFETVAFCEIEPFPRKVLAKHWPDVPCHPDIRNLKGSEIGAVDVICGGYPCQPFSTAGKRRGKEDDRHLWPEFMRLVAELRPAWVIGENVAGHVSMGLDDVLSDLEGEGYACRPFIIPACAKGAQHRRDRVWTVANAGDVLQPRKLVDGTDRSETARSKNSHECEGETPSGQRVRTELGPSGENVTNANGERQPEQGQPVKRMRGTAAEAWEADFPFDAVGRGIEPTIRRGDHGFSARMDRLKALGNSVVPQIPEMLGRAILEAAQ